jgi:hypothetical protein
MKRRMRKIFAQQTAAGGNFFQLKFLAMDVPTPPRNVLVNVTPPNWHVPMSRPLIEIG